MEIPPQIEGFYRLTYRRKFCEQAKEDTHGPNTQETAIPMTHQYD